MQSDIYNLKRFVDAQELVYGQALTELKAGRKEGHWIWFIFPQTPKAGMGALAKKYAIKTKEEAEAYLKHKVLGSRLIECVEAVLKHKDKPLERIFGSELDAIKFISSMRLFRHVGGEGSVFERALEIYKL